MKPLALALAVAATLAAASTATAQMREYPVRTPVPAGAIELSAGVYPKEGQIVLEDNMPGHRRFKAPLFPNAGWDSPMRADGQKDYDRYLIDYWRAPYLAPGELNPAYPGQEQRGYVSPGPHAARIARSAATAAEDALFERRMQFIVEQVLASAPMRDLHAPALSPNSPSPATARPTAGAATALCAARSSWSWTSSPPGPASQSGCRTARSSHPIPARP